MFLFLSFFLGLLLFLFVDLLFFVFFWICYLILFGYFLCVGFRIGIYFREFY